MTGLGEKVADFPPAASLQPRVRVLDRIAAILEAAPTHGPSGLPGAYSHRALAQLVYGADDPTAAQLSAVRRAVAKLVTSGRATRDRDRRQDDTAGYRTHERRRGGYVFKYANPERVVAVRRAPTAADREARAAALERIARR
jgi:hypothetical protein